MNFEHDPADEVFQADVRSYIRTTLADLFPDRVRSGIGAPYTKADMQRWTRALNAKSLLVPHWPQEWGGTAWPANWRRILDEELAAVDCPSTDAIGTDFVGPVLCAFGNQEQKTRYLRAIREGKQFWCQGFSEPGAGSDTMSLSATAVQERDHFIVNGHKVWTSNAHFSDMMFALLRIETPGVRRQQGLSFLLIDMYSAGVTVRPLILIDGVHRVNEVLLENVRVPTGNLIGERGKGWVYARYLLANERTVVAGLGRTRTLIRELRRIATEELGNRPSVLNDPVFAARLSQVEVELQALDFMDLRWLHSRTDDGGAQMLPPILKLRGTELRQRVAELIMKHLGDQALELPSQNQGQDQTPISGQPPFVANAVRNFLFQRSATIAGGTSEIQRNLIAGLALQS